MSSAYAYGYGFGFAFDAETKLKAGDRVKHFVSGDLGTIGSFVSGNAVVTWDRGGSTSILSPAILVKAGGGDAEITVSPRGGANSERHPAEYEVDRADIAGRTGTTGGPPTHKATGEGRVRGGRMVMSSGTTWPSNDALGIKGSEYLGRAAIAKQSEQRRRQQLRWEYKNTPGSLSEAERKEVESNFKADKSAE